MYTLRKLQAKRTQKRNKTKRVRGGKPTPNQLLRAIERLPAPPTALPPTQKEIEQAQKARTQNEQKKRALIRTHMNKLLLNLKKTMNSQFIGPPHDKIFKKRKTWIEKWTEIMKEMDALAKTESVVNGKIDFHFTEKGGAGEAMRLMR